MPFSAPANPNNMKPIIRSRDFSAFSICSGESVKIVAMCWLSDNCMILLSCTLATNDNAFIMFFTLIASMTDPKMLRIEAIPLKTSGLNKSKFVK